MSETVMHVWCKWYGCGHEAKMPIGEALFDSDPKPCPVCQESEQAAETRRAGALRTATEEA